jgi:hypothetical protein
MTVIIDRLLEPIIQYSLIDSDAIEFISEKTLSSLSKRLPMALSAGKKRDYETAYFFKNARALGRLAKDKSSTAGCPVGAVLFRDADGTRSTEMGLFEQKWKSIEDGFNAEEFANGVPMVPKPKSEAWILCAIVAQPYHNCSQLELTLTGNDRAPNPAKVQLEERLDQIDREKHDLPDMVRDGTIDPFKIVMPSFNRFRQRLENVIHIMLGHPLI